MRPRPIHLVSSLLVLVALASLPVAAADAIIEEANTLLSEGEYRKAWSRFQEAASTQGPTVAALTGMARAAIPLGEYAVAAELAGQVADGAPGISDKVEALTLLGRAHMEATFFSPEHRAAEEAAGIGYLDRAVEQFSAAVALSQALASEATYWLALSHLERGEDEQAAEIAATYLQQRPEGEFAEAARSIQKATAGESADPGADASADVTPPAAKRALRPDYSGKARKQGVCGVVIVQGVVDAEGRYEETVLLKGLEPDLDERLLEQISRSRFDPAQAGGTPTPVYHRVAIPIKGRGSDPSRRIIPVE